MDTDAWVPARLIPTSGIRGSDEQETRATSALLAVIGAVKDFGRSVLSEAGAPAGRISTYTEVAFLDGEEAKVRPDGVVVVTLGSRQWVALVETKTGQSVLDSRQVERYVDLANREGFDAVITISNDFVAPSAPHPVQVAARKLKKVQLHHWSWTRILTHAIVLKNRQAIADTEQAWILEELIRYLEHPHSGALDFDGLGPHWVKIRESARNGTLRPGDRGIDDVAARWDQFLEYLCLRLGRDLSVDPHVVVPRAHRRDPRKRMADLVSGLTSPSSSVLAGTLRIPGAAGDIELEADLRARMVRARVVVAAPRKGRPQTRINWLLRQIKSAPPDTQIEVDFGFRRSTSDTLARARERPELLLLADDPKRDPARLSVSLVRDMGLKSGRRRGSFVTVFEQLAYDFYHTVLQDIRPWVPPPPRLREETAPETVDQTAEPAAPSSIPAVARSLAPLSDPVPPERALSGTPSTAEQSVSPPNWLMRGE